MSKKVLLINPRNVAYTLAGGKALPLGIAYLASTLIKNGHSVKCLDLQVQSDVTLLNDITEADIVGISTVTPSIKEAWRLAEIAKNKNKLVVLGGPHASVFPEESLKTGKVDIVCRKEAEETFLEVVEGKLPLKSILGISYIENGNVLNNEDRPYISNIDLIPFPARNLFPAMDYKVYMHKGKNVMQILTSRGCPNDCNFCYKGISGRKYRMRSVDNIMAEWEEMERMGADEIVTSDDSFTVNKKRVIELCNYLIKAKKKTFWEGSSRVDTVDREMLFKMKESGYWRIAYGIESGSSRILETIGKGITKEKAVNAVKWAKEAGLEVTGFFVLGNYGETEATMNETIAFAKSLPLDYIQFTVAVPYPGTKLLDMVKKDGKLLFNDWSELGSYSGKAFFEQGELNSALVEKMFKKAYRSVYLSPRMIIKNLKRFNPQMLRFWRLLK